jgi:AcrR family transcriptional regulator
MGHREDLLEGAKKCLLEIGYANTTARDIVAASGTNLASIGYHFGSKEALMTQAIIELLGDWGEKFAQPPTETDLGYRDRFRSVWTTVLEAMESDPKLALASFENFTHSARQPELGAIVAEGQQQGRIAFGEDFSDPRQPADAKTRQAIGSVMLAITSGLIAQKLIDPIRSPSADDVLLAFEYVAGALARESKKRSR